MSVFEPRGKYQTANGCAFCRWCDPTTVYASNPPRYYCSKFNTYVYCGQTTCQSDLEDGQFIGADGHKYHVEFKHGKDWSSYSLKDDTVGEWLNLSKRAEEKKKAEKKPEERIDVVRDFSPKEEAEQKKGEEKKRPCDGCENSEWYPRGWYCQRFGQQITMDRQTCIADEREEEQRKLVDISRYCKTAIFDPSKPTIEERIEALEKKVEDLEKRLRNY